MRPPAVQRKGDKHTEDSPVVRPKDAVPTEKAGRFIATGFFRWYSIWQKRVYNLIGHTLILDELFDFPL